MMLSLRGVLRQTLRTTKQSRWNPDFAIWMAMLALAMTPMPFLSCSSSNSIFPSTPVSTDLSELELPNPIAIVADEARSQIVVANSNVDIFFRQGSLAVISVDATDPSDPVLEATQVITTPNYAGHMAFDGNFAYIPFREETSGGSKEDQIVKYTIGGGSIETGATGTVTSNPFGIALSGSSVVVVSDKKLNILDTDLNTDDTVDLTTASTANIADAGSSDVENVAVDPGTNRAFLSNRKGKILVVDLGNNTLTHVIDGPINSRGAASDGTFIYVVDGDPPALWVLDPSQLSAPDDPPVEVDDSKLTVAVIPVGVNPNGIAIDAANSRAYVANSSDRNVSVIDLNLLEEIARISLKKEDTGFEEAKDPFGLAVGTFDGVPLVFVANFSSNSISVINANTLEVVGLFP